MSKILGIDLGTTNSAFAVIEVGEPKILENAEGARTTPSIIAVSKTGERLVGLLARRQAVTNPKNTVFGIKRFIGHSFDDEVVQKDMPIVPYAMKKGADGAVLVTLGDKDYRPEEISAMILGKIKADAEAKIGEKITEAVITVPAYFNDAQRKATKDAGKIAGLDVKRIINEPTAAALAYGFNKKKNEQIAVFDFGGGTFDVSVLEVSDDEGEQSIEVRATGGDSHMGGKDIDQKVIGWIVDEFKKESGIDVSKDPLALQRLDEAAEKAKIELSSAVDTEINIPFITSDAEGPKHLILKLTRAKLEEISAEFVDRSIEITKQVVADSGFSFADIDEVILVGGQTRMPVIISKVQEMFGKEPNRSINPDEVVALGAAVQAGIFQGDVKDVLLLDVTPLSLGIETMGSVATKLIEKNTTIPTTKSQTFSTAADNQTSVEIHIVQGERPMAHDNKSLGRFILDGVPPSPRGVPQVEVTFDIDANGILNVKAKEKTSGKEQSIRIEASSGLTDEDIAKMTADALAHEEEDKKKKESAESVNLADQMVYTAEKALKDGGDKVPADVQASVKEKIEAVRAAQKDNNVEEIKKASEALSTEMQKIGSAMAGAQTNADGTQTDADQPAQTDGASPNPSEDGQVKDAEFTEGGEAEAEGEKKDDQPGTGTPPTA